MIVSVPTTTVTAAPLSVPVLPLTVKPAAFSAMFTTSSPATWSRVSGSVGVAAGVAVASFSAPPPTAFTARTSKVCWSPLERPATV